MLDPCELLTGSKKQQSLRLTESMIEAIKQRSNQWGTNFNQTVERILVKGLNDETQSNIFRSQPLSTQSNFRAYSQSSRVSESTTEDLSNHLENPSKN